MGSQLYYNTSKASILIRLLSPLWLMRFVILSGVVSNFSDFVWVLDTLSFQVAPSLVSGSFLMWMWWSVLCWVFKENTLQISGILPLKISRILSLCCFLCFCTILKIYLLWFPCIFSSISSILWVCQDLLGFCLLVLCLKTLASQWTWTILGLSLLVSHISGNIALLFPDISFLFEDCYFI